MTEPDVATATPARPPRLFWLGLAIAVVVVLLDQLSKWWAVANLSDGKTIPVIGDLIQFWLTYNSGAAFSFGEGFTWVFTIAAGLAVIGIVWFSWTVRSLPWSITLGLLLGGALTHLGDRLFREPSFGQGHVVDFIAYKGLFVGNVADIVIVGCAVLIVVLTLMKVHTGRPTTED
jgi:signal peptidase II